MVIKDSASISIDEAWPAGYASYKKLSYKGPGIRTSDYNENDGDAIISSVESWKLEKESLYRTYSNRTVWDVFITPADVIVKKGTNKSSFYALNLNSIGSLTHLGVVRQSQSQQQPEVRISEDYSGQHNITLKISMDDNVYRKRDEDSWLPCCSGGYFDMNKNDRIELNSDRIFNCTCLSNR